VPKIIKSSPFSFELLIKWINIDQNKIKEKKKSPPKSETTQQVYSALTLK
jgi:hypothetical protein